MRTNLLTYLEETVRVVPDKIAFFDENGGLSFRQLYDQARGIGSFLYRAGYYAQPVVVLMQRSPRAIAAFLGAIYAGCWYVPLGAEMPRSRLEQILQELTPGALLCDGETEGLARSLAWKDGIFRYEEAAFGAIDEEPLRGIRWRQALPHARFLNLYGPTEATGICCYYEVDRDFSEEETLPLGQPFPNTQILLLDENGQQAAPGAQGEICVRGSRLTLGYYRAPELTERSFVQNPLNGAYFDRIYRTGDLGRINERGELVFLGRKDQQVKHMGHRVELGEIEAAALRHPQIQSSCCVHDGQSGRLVLYYAGALTTGELALWLREKLPRYMVPNRLVKLAALPLTPNGKIDRIRLQQADRRE